MHFVWMVRGGRFSGTWTRDSRREAETMAMLLGLNGGTVTEVNGNFILEV